jgi:hypothetical protein
MNKNVKFILGLAGGWYISFIIYKKYWEKGKSIDMNKKSDIIVNLTDTSISKEKEPIYIPATNVIPSVYDRGIGMEMELNMVGKCKCKGKCKNCSK